MNSILLVGATGLVGRSCLKLLLADSHFDRVVVLTRRPLPKHHLPRHDRLEEHIVDFSRLDDYAEAMGVDQIMCALGTTIKKAGSKPRFREVDYVYPLRIAALAQTRGASHYLIVTAVGADPDSFFFYNRVKGEVEQALHVLPYESLTIVRPSLLLGDRSEYRLGEEVARRAAFLVPARYRPVRAEDVASVLVEAARRGRPGVEVIESEEIRKKAGALA